MQPGGETQRIPERARDARLLMASRGFGVVSTFSKHTPGFPFGSIVNFAVDAQGRPIFVMSALAVHTKNIAENPKSSLTVYSAEAEDDVLSAARMTVLGEIHPVPDDEVVEVRATYFQRHPDAEQYVEFADFAVYRMEPAAVYHVGGFGAMGWVAPSDYSAASE